MKESVFEWQENREESLLCRPDWIADDDSFERFCEVDEFYRNKIGLNYDFVTYDDIIDNSRYICESNDSNKQDNVLRRQIVDVNTQKKYRLINKRFIPLPTKLSLKDFILERRRILVKSKWTKELLSAYINCMRGYFNIESCRRWQTWHYASNGGAVIAQLNYKNNKQEVEVIVDDSYTLFRILDKNDIHESQTMLYDFIKSKFNNFTICSNGYLIEANDDNLFMSVYHSFSK